MTDKDGERIARLEAQFEHMTKQLDDVSDKLDVAAKKLSEMSDMFERAKGAKYVIVGAAAIGGFVSAKLGWLVPPLFGK